MEQSVGIRKTVLRMLGVVVGMSAFGFALVPLYDVFCDVTGLNGKTGGRVAEAEVQVDEARTVKVQFLASLNAEMPWEFAPVEHEVSVHPGQTMNVAYLARNVSGSNMIAQAVPSVSPGQAARYLHKVECFCFQSQPLAAGEEKHMPIRFYIDPELPADVSVVTLSYTLFNVSESAQADIPAIVPAGFQAQ